MSGRVKPIGNWLWRGVETTTSASIPWIRLIICIRIIMSCVLVSCLRVITCLVDVCIFGYKIVCNCMIKRFSTLAYPLCLFVCSVCGFLFLRWSSIYWWEHMRELPVVVRLMEIPLLSLFRVESSYFRVSLFRLRLMYYLLSKHLFWILSNYFSILLLALWCALIFHFKYLGYM